MAEGCYSMSSGMRPAADLINTSGFQGQNYLTSALLIDGHWLHSGLLDFQKMDQQAVYCAPVHAINAHYLGLSKWDEDHREAGNWSPEFTWLYQHTRSFKKQYLQRAFVGLHTPHKKHPCFIFCSTTALKQALFL